MGFLIPDGEVLRPAGWELKARAGGKPDSILKFIRTEPVFLTC